MSAYSLTKRYLYTFLFVCIEPSGDANKSTKEGSAGSSVPAYATMTLRSVKKESDGITPISPNHSPASSRPQSAMSSPSPYLPSQSQSNNTSIQSPYLPSANRSTSPVRGAVGSTENNGNGGETVAEIKAKLGLTNVTFPYDVLKSDPPEGVDLKNKEVYLSTSMFLIVFGMDEKSYEVLPKWKKDLIKKKVGLF